MGSRSVPRLVVSTLVGVLVTGLSGVSPAAAAAPPANDSISAARVIQKIPLRITQNTTQATSSASDGPCVGSNSVWFRYRPTVTSTLRVVGIGSLIDTRLAVFRGPQGDRTLVACDDPDEEVGQAVLQVRFLAGATYWVAASTSDQYGGTGGGPLSLSLYRPRPAGAETTITSAEAGAVSGLLHVRGRTVCNTPSYVSVSFGASQRVGPYIARASGNETLLFCNRTGVSWESTASSSNDIAFVPGEALFDLSTFNADGFTQADLNETTVLPVGVSPNRAATT